MSPERDDPVIIPYDRLSPEALQGLIEEFVTRPGTDTGYTRGSLQESVESVRRQLVKGRACIVYDEKTETANIVPVGDMARKPVRTNRTG